MVSALILVEEVVVIMVEVVVTMVEVILEVVAQILAQEDGWDHMVVNILNERVIPHKEQFGPEQNVHVLQDKMTLEDIVENLPNKTVYHQEVLHGMTGSVYAFARVNT
jgi:hypothetical protein